MVSALADERGCVKAVSYTHLSWIGKPVIVLLNQMGKPQAPDIEHAQVEAWKTALKPWPFVKKVLEMCIRDRAGI